MAYDHELADRIRERVATERGIVEQAMFGGLAFLVNGNMAVAASRRGASRLADGGGGGGADRRRPGGMG